MVKGECLAIYNAWWYCLSYYFCNLKYVEYKRLRLVGGVSMDMDAVYCTRCGELVVLYLMEDDFGGKQYEGQCLECAMIMHKVWEDE